MKKLVNKVITKIKESKSLQVIGTLTASIIICVLSVKSGSITSLELEQFSKIGSLLSNALSSVACASLGTITISNVIKGVF